MQKRHEIQQKSRLGTLLIHKGLITRQQLDQALTQQAQSGQRLGELLVSNGWLTDRQLSRALKKQSRYRLVAAISAMLLGPIQPFMASANAATDDQTVAEQTFASRTGMQALNEADMANVSGQSLGPQYEQLIDVISGNANSEDELAATTLESLLGSFLPGSNLLESDLEISGVEYEPGPRTTLNADGSLDVKVPTHIRQIAFKNVRVAGASGSHFGDVTLRDINLEGVSVKVHLRP
ncbi:hypothetical protein [Bacterioplanoides sp.]|uniref:hypothetical protein n=1 Tax=Bacterioplanoides sp. TaxID=2066072 RepID=UPI003AFF760A